MGYATIDKIIEDAGFGSFSLKLMLLISIFYFLDLSQLALPAILLPYMKCEWDMTAFETSLISSCVYFGSAVGASYFGRLGDLYGRKTVLYTCLAMIIYFNILALFAGSAMSYALPSMFIGIGTGGSVVNIIAYSSELFPSKWRGKVMAVALFFSSSGAMYTNAMGYVMLNRFGWKPLLLVMLIPSVILILSMHWIPESVRYLQISGDKNSNENIKQILTRLTTGNGKYFLTSVNIVSNFGIKKKIVESKQGFSMLFGRKYGKLTISLVVLSVTFLTTYFSMMFLSVYAVKNPEECWPQKKTLKPLVKMHPVEIAVAPNLCAVISDLQLRENILLSLSELPGEILYFFIIDIIGRKWSISCSFIYLSVVFFLHEFCLAKWFNIASILSGRAIASGMSISYFVLISESFPTALRSSGVGLCSSVGRWAVMLVPLLFQDIIYTAHTAVISIFAILNFISFLICLTLKDTTGKSLDDIHC